MNEQRIPALLWRISLFALRCRRPFTARKTARHTACAGYFHEILHLGKAVCSCLHGRVADLAALKVQARELDQRLELRQAGVAEGGFLSSNSSRLTRPARFARPASVSRVCQRSSLEAAVR